MSTTGPRRHAGGRLLRSYGLAADEENELCLVMRDVEGNELCLD
jgi:hypothetical protein